MVKGQDYSERRRIQNLMAQRRWRQKNKERKTLTSRKESQRPRSTGQSHNHPLRPITPYTIPDCHEFSDALSTTTNESWPDPMTPPEPVHIEQPLRIPDVTSSPFMVPGTLENQFSQWPVLASPDSIELSFSGYTAAPWLPPTSQSPLVARLEDEAAQYTNNPDNSFSMGSFPSLPKTRDELERSILESIETAAGLYEHGMALGLLPESYRLPEKLAGAKSVILSSDR